MKLNLDNILAWLLGIGVVLFAFRTTVFNGILVGLVICLLVVFFLLRQSKYWTKETLGSKYVYIPLAVISASIIVSGIYQYTQNGVMDTLITRIAVGFLFFGVYLSARILGEKIFKPFAIAVVVETVSVVVFSLIINYGIHNGGLVSVTDYNTAVALLLFGAIVSIFYKQWVITSVAVVGIFFTGAEEGIIAVAIIFITILIRRDFSKKLLIPICSIIIIAFLGLVPFSYTRTLYAMPIDKASILLTHKHNEQSLQVFKTPSKNTTITEPDTFKSKYDYLLNGRFSIMFKALNNLKPLGSGYVLNPVDNTDSPIYNVPLVILQQVGGLAALAWVFLTIYCLIKTKWRYAFIALIGLGLFDNYVWCQLGVWWFIIVGISTVSNIKSDLIFKSSG
jgi:hypothetical protein